LAVSPRWGHARRCVNIVSRRWGAARSITVCQERPIQPDGLLGLLPLPSRLSLNPEFLVEGGEAGSARGVSLVLLAIVQIEPQPAAKKRLMMLRDAGGYQG